MKHRGKKSSKIKYDHHMIPDLRPFLEEIQHWDEIKTIIPGRINKRKGSGKLEMHVQYLTSSGLKCLVQSRSAVQEVFFVTSAPNELIERLSKLPQVHMSANDTSVQTCH